MIRRIVLASLAIGVCAVSISCAGDHDASAEVTAAAAPAKPAVTAATLELGRAKYKEFCVACHGDSGKGDGPGAGVFKPPPTNHTDAVYMKTLTDKDLASVIQMGGAMRGKPLMPSHPQIRGADLDALVAYVRSLSSGK